MAIENKNNMPIDQIWNKPNLLALPKGRIFYIECKYKREALLKRMKKLSRKGYFVRVKPKTKGYILFQRTGLK